MMNTNTEAIRIPRTTAMEARMTKQMKFLLGADVQIGAVYDGWEDMKDNRQCMPCEALHYDGDYLYLHILGTPTVTLALGDVADYHGMLVVSRVGNSYNIDDLRDRVHTYMQDHGISEYNRDVGYHALWQAKHPRSLTHERCRVYELTRKIDIKSTSDK